MHSDHDRQRASHGASDPTPRRSKIARCYLAVSEPDGPDPSVSYLTTRYRRCVTAGDWIASMHSSSTWSAPGSSNSRTPSPIRIGATWIRSSSSSPAFRYCCATLAPPATPTFLEPAALPRPLERRLDPVGDEVERRPALHLERLALVVGEDENGHAEGRGVPPPAHGVRVVLPGPGSAAVHLPAHDHRAVGSERLTDEVVVGAGLTARAAMALRRRCEARTSTREAASPPTPKRVLQRRCPARSCSRRATSWSRRSASPSGASSSRGRPALRRSLSS